MYGTAVESAVLSMKTTSRLPESIKEPIVGQPDAGSGRVVGEYASVSRPAAEKTVPYRVAGMLLMFTINIDTTENELSQRYK